jgi:hypothetical protein
MKIWLISYVINTAAQLGTDVVTVDYLHWRRDGGKGADLGFR